MGKGRAGRTAEPLRPKHPGPAVLIPQHLMRFEESLYGTRFGYPCQHHLPSAESQSHQASPTYPKGGDVPPDTPISRHKAEAEPTQALQLPNPTGALENTVLGVSASQKQRWKKTSGRPGWMGTWSKPGQGGAVPGHGRGFGTRQALRSFPT